MRVCLVIEGSYPFITGGVSSWVHELISGLSEIEFVLFTSPPQADQELRYKLPPNVVGVTDVVLSDKSRFSRGRRREGGDALGANAVRGILASHLRMFSGGVPSLEELIGAIPEGVSLHRDSVLDGRSWRFVQAQNRLRNPSIPTRLLSGPGRAPTISYSTCSRPLLPRPISTTRSRRASRASRPSRQSAARQELPPHRARPLSQGARDRDTQSRPSSAAISATSGYASTTESHACATRAPTSAHPSSRRIDAISSSSGPSREDGRHTQRHRRYALLGSRIKKDEDFHVGFVGRIVPIKDVKTFIVAAKLVLERIPNARFHLIGPDDEDPRIRQKSASASPPTSRSTTALEFHGQGGRARVLQFSSTSSSSTSVREAQPLVILECLRRPHTLRGDRRRQCIGAAPMETALYRAF